MATALASPDCKLFFSKLYLYIFLYCHNTHHLLPPQIIAFWVREWVSLWSSGPACFSCTKGVQRGSSLSAHNSQCQLSTHCFTRHYQLPSWVGQSLGLCLSRLPCTVRDPLVSASRCVWWRDCWEAVPGRLPPPPMWGGRSSWHPGPAGSLQAEVRPVSWTDSLLQGQRADRVLRQMEPRPLLIYPKAPPPMRSVERTTSPSVLFSHFFFSCVSSENEKESVTMS